jgi:hypothetical protein
MRTVVDMRFRYLMTEHAVGMKVGNFAFLCVILKLFDGLRYKMPLDNIGVTKFNSNVFSQRLKSEVSSDQVDLVNVLREAILICDGVLSLYDSTFHRDDFVCSINECSISLFKLAPGFFVYILIFLLTASLCNFFLI